MGKLKSIRAMESLNNTEYNYNLTEGTKKTEVRIIESLSQTLHFVIDVLGAVAFTMSRIVEKSGCFVLNHMNGYQIRSAN